MAYLLAIQTHGRPKSERNPRPRRYHHLSCREDILNVTGLGRAWWISMEAPQVSEDASEHLRLEGFDEDISCLFVSRRGPNRETKVSVSEEMVVGVGVVTAEEEASRGRGGLGFRLGDLEILKARVHLSRGLCRRIGDRSATSIWFDPWVLGVNPLPTPWVEDVSGVSLVSNFINNNQWDEDLINHWFHAEDARRIINITLPDRPVVNSWLWMPESNGCFSIKSAYRVIKNLNSSNDGDNDLLTKGKLGPILSLTDTSCPLCCSAVEYSFHLIWDCPFAQAVCQIGLQISIIISFLEGRTIIFQNIWRVRNALIHDKKTTPLRATVININSRLLELLEIHSITTGTISDWLPPRPPAGWITCNTDIAIGNNQSAGAAIFRDHNSQTKVSILSRSNIVIQAGEVAALCEGAIEAVRQGYKNVIFQSNSSNAIEVLLKTPQDIKLLHYNIQELVCKFHHSMASLNLWEACWIPKPYNRVAHSVAQGANCCKAFGHFDSPSAFGSPHSLIANGHNLSSLS
uniref:RNase H type-1 domain-containing protein n=1 Tax=Cannabis sativa TaxID=3483 RepID=A0A803P6Z1_CANSA